jgi:hypothetical protein
MQNAKVTEIRSLGFKKINRLVRAARHLDGLRPAFAEWQSGEIYICKKTNTYRYRHGDKSKSVAPWSKMVQELFDSPATFALAAMVLETTAPEKRAAADVEVAFTVHKLDRSERANVIKLASVA